MDSHIQAAAQFWVPHQHEAEPVVGVHRVVGEKAKVFEHITPEVVRFIDDQDRLLFGCVLRPIVITRSLCANVRETPRFCLIRAAGRRFPARRDQDC